MHILWLKYEYLLFTLTYPWCNDNTIIVYLWNYRYKCSIPIQVVSTQFVQTQNMVKWVGIQDRYKYSVMSFFYLRIHCLEENSQHLNLMTTSNLFYPWLVRRAKIRLRVFLDGSAAHTVSPSTHIFTTGSDTSLLLNIIPRLGILHKALLYIKSNNYDFLHFS